MDSLNLPRQGLLLELVRDITQNNTAGYSDEQIYENVVDYKELLKEFKEKQKSGEILSFKDEERLNKLHIYFYGEHFNFRDPSQNGLGHGDNIYVEFKKVFDKIEELAKTKEVLSEQLSQILRELVGSVAYTNSGSDEQLMSYLNLISSTLSSYKPPDSDSLKVKKEYTKTEDFKKNRDDIKRKAEEIKTEKEKKIEKEKTDINDRIKKAEEAERERKDKEKRDKEDERRKELERMQAQNGNEERRDDTQEVKGKKIKKEERGCDEIKFDLKDSVKNYKRYLDSFKKKFDLNDEQLKEIDDEWRSDPFKSLKMEEFQQQFLKKKGQDVSDVMHEVDKYFLTQEEIEFIIKYNRENKIYKHCIDQEKFDKIKRKRYETKGQGDINYLIGVINGDLKSQFKSFLNDDAEKIADHFKERREIKKQELKEYEKMADTFKQLSKEDEEQNKRNQNIVYSHLLKNYVLIQYYFQLVSSLYQDNKSLLLEEINEIFNKFKDIDEENLNKDNHLENLPIIRDLILNCVVFKIQEYKSEVAKNKEEKKDKDEDLEKFSKIEDELLLIIHLLFNIQEQENYYKPVNISLFNSKIHEFQNIQYKDLYIDFLLHFSLEITMKKVKKAYITKDKTSKDEFKPLIRKIHRVFEILLSLNFFTDETAKSNIEEFQKINKSNIETQPYHYDTLIKNLFAKVDKFKIKEELYLVKDISNLRVTASSEPLEILKELNSLIFKSFDTFLNVKAIRKVNLITDENKQAPILKYMIKINNEIIKGETKFLKKIKIFIQHYLSEYIKEFKDIAKTINTSECSLIKDIIKILYDTEEKDDNSYVLLEVANNTFNTVSNYKNFYDKLVICDKLKVFETPIEKLKALAELYKNFKIDKPEEYNRLFLSINNDKNIEFNKTNKDLKERINNFIKIYFKEYLNQSDNWKIASDCEIINKILEIFCQIKENNCKEADNNIEKLEKLITFCALPENNNSKKFYLHLLFITNTDVNYLLSKYTENDYEKNIKKIINTLTDINGLIDYSDELIVFYNSYLQEQSEQELTNNDIDDNVKELINKYDKFKTIKFILNVFSYYHLAIFKDKYVDEKFNLYLEDTEKEGYIYDYDIYKDIKKIYKYLFIFLFTNNITYKTFLNLKKCISNIVNESIHKQDKTKIEYLTKTVTKTGQKMSLAELKGYSFIYYDSKTDYKDLKIQDTKLNELLLYKKDKEGTFYDKYVDFLYLINLIIPFAIYEIDDKKIKEILTKNNKLKLLKIIPEKLNENNKKLLANELKCKYTSKRHPYSNKNDQSYIIKSDHNNEYKVLKEIYQYCYLNTLNTKTNPCVFEKYNNLLKSLIDGEFKEQDLFAYEFENNQLILKQEEQVTKKAPTNQVSATSSYINQSQIKPTPIEFATRLLSERVKSVQQTAQAKAASQGGTMTNSFKLLDVFKLFYNFVAIKDFDNSYMTIYKLFFMLNSYGYYNEDQTLILKLKEIIERGIYTDEIIEIIKNTLSIIKERTQQIFNEYIKVFNDTDKIIKNYYKTNNEIVKYLAINFFYNFFKNLEKSDISLKLVINGITLDISKTHIEINKEINEMINNNDFFFNINEIIIDKDNDISKSTIADINYFFTFIYDLTSKPEGTELIINNSSDLNAYIVMQLLENDSISHLTVNYNDYELPAIKNKPYKFLFDNQIPLKVIVNLNKCQTELYEYILKSENLSKLFEILRINFNFIKFELTHKYKYKYFINSEIIRLIEPKITIKKSLINYKHTNYQDYNFLSIFKLNDIKIISYINYALYLSASLFSKISEYNFESLIYLHAIIKNNLEDYWQIINYSGNDAIILRYKKFLGEVELLKFIEETLLYLRSRIDISSNIDNFISILIRFKGMNPILSGIEINLDKEFLITLFANVYKDKEIDFYETINKELELLFDIYDNETNNFTGEYRELRDYFINPLMIAMNRKGFDINKLEMRLLDFNTSILKQIIIPKPKKISGGFGENTPITLVEQQTKDKDFIYEKLNEIDKFYGKFDDFKEKFYKKDGERTTGFVIDADKNLENFMKLNDNQTIDNITYPTENDSNFSSTINKLESAVKNNKRQIEKTIEDKSLSEKIKKLKETLQDIIDNILPSLKNYTNIDEILVKINLANYFALKDDKEPTILFDIKNYLNKCESIVDYYKSELENLKSRYEDQIKIIEQMKENYQIVIKSKKEDRQSIFPFREGGGKGKIKRFSGGEGKIKKKYETDLAYEKGQIEKLPNIRKDFNKLKAATSLSKSNPANEEIIENIYDEKGDSIFERILFQYDKDAKANIPEIAKGRLYDAVVDNNLDPEIELEINIIDKVIFIIVIVILRTAALQIVNYFIDKDTITTVKESIKYYAISYTLIFITLFTIINIDVFRLRLLINYMNMHINASGILTHIVLSMIISYIVYLLLINMSPENKPSRLSKNQKIKLKMRAEILSIAILTLLIIFILVV